MEIFGTLLVTVLVLLLLMHRRGGAVKLPPGPFALPIIGNLPFLDKKAPFNSFVKWSKKYGTVLTVYIGPQRAVILVGYETVREALVDQADDFRGRFVLPFAKKLFDGYGLGFSNGDRWTQLRRFTLSTLRDFGMGRKRMEEWIREESTFLLASLKETNGAPFEPSFFISRAVSNVICALVFGQRFDYEDRHFLHLLQIISELLRFFSSPLGQLFNIFPRIMDALPGRHQRIFKQTKDINSFIEQKVKEHERDLSPDSPRDFIDCFLLRLAQEKEMPASEFHMENLVATCINLFFAGTETTSTTIRYALLILIKHPEIQQKMQSEIDTVIGRDRGPFMEDRKSMPFTDAVIHEVQRYLDLVPHSLPHCATRTVSFRGYTIPKGTVIIPLLHSVLRDEKQWESPWTFNPKHFLDNNSNFKKNPAFMPFAAGKRACVGESLARMELFLFLVTLLQNFTFSTPDGPDCLDTKPEFSSFGNLPHRYQLIATPR